MSTRRHEAKVFRELFKKLLPGDSWKPWQAILAATFAFPPRKGELALYQQVTGRQTWPSEPAKELWCVAGRRSGKTRISALVATYCAAFRTYSLAPGERAVMPIVCPGRRQGQVALGYVKSFLQASPALAAMVTGETAESISLSTGITVEVFTASSRNIRGFTLCGCIADEIAFWRDDSSLDPDKAILDAARPAMSTIDQGLLIGISTPHGKTGELWSIFSKHYAQEDDPVLVIQADTRTMNTTIRQDVIDRAVERDEEVARAEYGARFRQDLERPFGRDVLTDATPPGIEERAPVEGIIYRAFVDPSGGSQDSMTLAISHRGADGRAILDVVREVQPPFSPEQVTKEFAGLLARYHVDIIEGDRYGGLWPAQAFQRYNVTYRPTARTKTELYAETIPLLNAGRIELLDLPRLTAQYAALERRVTRGGKDSIDHRPGAHDDVANAASGALLMTAVSLNLPQLPDSFNVCWLERNLPHFHRHACFPVRHERAVRAVR